MEFTGGLNCYNMAKSTFTKGQKLEQFKQEGKP